jgi:hypothetical protein
MEGDARTICRASASIDPRGLLRQAFPDRQQQPGDDVQGPLRELRHFGKLGLPRRGKPIADGSGERIALSVAYAHGRTVTRFPATIIETAQSQDRVARPSSQR